MADHGLSPRVLLDRYELREQVGRGGMGEVWMGWDRRLMRDVAVKILLPELSAEPAYRERFHREARIAAALEHPNVVNVFDIDEDGETLFIVMERLPGPSLDHRLMEGPLGEDEVLRLASDMLAGLGAAHRLGLIHRDMKPGNLIKSAGGRWKVGDFGVAKDLASTAHLTLAGVPVGTPAYLAPEQLDGRGATPATDLWAAAIVLREALTGRSPFPGEDPIAVAHAIQTTRLAPLAEVRPDLHPPLTASVDRALAFDPAQRFGSADEMLAAIEGRVIATPEPVAAPLPSPVPAAAPGPAVAEPPEATPQGAEPADPVFVSSSGPNLSAETDRTVRRVGLVTIVLGLLALVFLVGVSLGLLMLTSDDGGETPPPSSYVPDGTSEPGGIQPGDGEPGGTPASNLPPPTEPPSTTVGESPPETAENEPGPPEEPTESSPPGATAGQDG